MPTEEDQLDWTNPQYCPYCGSDDLAKSEDWKQRDCPVPEELRTTESQVSFRLHGYNECNACGGEFETMSEIKTHTPRYNTHTIQVAWDSEDQNSIVGVKYIEGDENDISVKAERAKWNMMFGGCGEFQGPEYAMRDLYNFLLENVDIEAEEEEFEAGKWLVRTE